MILLLTDRAGREYRVGVADGQYSDPDDCPGPVVDRRPLIAMPGLVDCHAHLSADDVEDMVRLDGSDFAAKMRAYALLQMEGGVLLVADKGSRSSLTLRFLDEDELLRPRMQMAGRMLAAADGYFPGCAAEADAENLAGLVNQATEGGASWVKVVGDWPRRGLGPIANFDEPALKQIVAIAHAAGCRVAVHTTAPGTPSMAVRAGADSIEHGLFLKTDDLAALGARGGAWVPTVAAMEATVASLGESSSGGRLLTRGLENVATLLGDAIEAGVGVLAGTDLVLPHGHVAKEAIKLVEYGLSPAQALHAVTGAAYDYLGFDAGFVPGNPADLVLFEGDPAGDLRLLLSPVLVMRAGRVVLGAL